VEHHAGHLAAAHRHRHGQRPIGQLRVVALAEGNPSTRREATSRTETRWSLPSPVRISVPSPNHLRLICWAGKSRLTRSGARQRPVPGRVVERRRLLRLATQALLVHQRRDGVLAHPPPGIAQVGGDPRRAVLGFVQLEQPPDPDRQPSAVTSRRAICRARIATDPVDSVQAPNASAAIVCANRTAPGSSPSLRIWAASDHPDECSLLKLLIIPYDDVAWLGPRITAIARMVAVSVWATLCRALLTARNASTDRLSFKPPALDRPVHGGSVPSCIRGSVVK
jgi:hypothetical protein